MRLIVLSGRISRGNWSNALGIVGARSWMWQSILTGGHKCGARSNSTVCHLGPFDDCRSTWPMHRQRRPIWGNCLCRNWYVITINWALGVWYTSAPKIRNPILIKLTVLPQPSFTIYQQIWHWLKSVAGNFRCLHRDALMSTMSFTNSNRKQLPASD